MILTESLQQAMLFLPLSLGVMLSYRITKLTDLTVEASFLTGSAVFVRLMEFMPVSVALILGILSGCITGGFSTLIQRHGRMNSLMASILAVFMFFSINLLIMGRPHIPLTILVPMWANIALVLVTVLFLYVLLSSHYGLKLKAFGDNPKLFQDLFGTQEKYRLLGLCISNVCAVIAGLMTALHQGYVDLYMGQGVALLGIGTVVVSERLFRVMPVQSGNQKNGKAPLGSRFRGNDIFVAITTVAVSVWLYFILSHLLLLFDVSTIYLRLIIGMILILTLRRAS